MSFVAALGFVAATVFVAAVVFDAAVVFITEVSLLLLSRPSHPLLPQPVLPP